MAEIATMRESRMAGLLGDPPRLPKEAFRFWGRLLVLGSGRSVRQDIEDAGRYDDIMYLNQAGIHLGMPASHWFSAHGDQIPEWHKARTGNGFTAIPYWHGIEGLGPTDPVNAPKIIPWPVSPGGTSALPACVVALALGYERVTLCGCPLDGRGHFYDPPDITDNVNLEPHLEQRWKHFALNVFKGRVRSMSGPSSEWLS